MSDEAIALHAENGSRLPTAHSTMHLYPIDGAAHEIGKSDTAFSYRDARYAEVIVGVDPDPANNEKITSWTKDYWSACTRSPAGSLRQLHDGGGHDRVRDSYRDNYDRLVEIKTKYDPANFFR